MKQRSAAERSWVAHIGLLALVMLAFAPLVLPSWTVEAPALLGAGAGPADGRGSRPRGVDCRSASSAEPRSDALQPQAAAAASASISPIAAATALYAVPAAILLFITLLALAPADRAARPRRRAGRRPLAERARPRAAAHGLQARHRAAHQRRARLADQLGPDAPGHPAQQPRGRSGRRSRGDHRPRARPRRAASTGSSCCSPASPPPCSGSTRWSGCSPAKRTSCARKRPTTRCSPPTSPTPIMPSCWSASPATNAPACCSARMASRRRRARWPAASPACSTARSVRGPAARSFAAGVFVGAVAIAAPLAALTLTPKGTAANAKLAAASKPSASEPGSAYYPGDCRPDRPAEHHQPGRRDFGPKRRCRDQLPSAIGAQSPATSKPISPSGASVRSVNGVIVARSSERRHRHRLPARRERPPQDRLRRTERRHRDHLRRRRTRTSLASTDKQNAEKRDRDSDRDESGRRYARSISPRCARRRRGFAMPTPTTCRNEGRRRHAGICPRPGVRRLFSNLDAGDLTEARAVGVTGAYIREMRGAGFNSSDLDDYVEMRAVGVTAGYANKFKKAGYRAPTAEQLVRAKAHDIDLDELRADRRRLRTAADAECATASQRQRRTGRLTNRLTEYRLN